jgi:hypothetical protein
MLRPVLTPINQGRTVKDVVGGHTGHWRDFTFQQNAAKVTKSSGSSSITLNVPQANRTATWTVASNAAQVTISKDCCACLVVGLPQCYLSFTCADQAGKLLVKDTGAIGAGKTSFVDFNDDRILFYPNVHSPDFSAVVRCP